MHLIEEFWQQNHILFLVVSSLNEDKYSLHYYTAFAFHCSYTFEWYQRERLEDFSLLPVPHKIFN